MADWTDQDSDWEAAPAAAAHGAGLSAPPPRAAGATVAPAWWQTRSVPQGAWVTALIAIAAWNLWRQRLFFHDDAFIELRYVHHLLTLGQAVWNPGEWVEGFTSVLHLLLVTGVAWWGQASGLSLPGAAHAVNFVAYAVVLGSGWLTLRQVSPQHLWPRLAGMAVLVGSAPLAIWVWGALEAPLASAWVSLAWMFWTRATLRQGQAVHPSAWACVPVGVCMALAVATRPDTLLLLLGALAAGLWAERPGQGVGVRGWRGWRAWRAWTWRWAPSVAAILIPMALIQGLLLWARWTLYGDVAPNTYYAKVHGIAVLHRLHTGGLYLLRTVLDVPALLGVPVLLVLMRAAWQDRWVLRCAAGVGLFVAGLWWVGGDHMAAGRFVVPALPLLAVCVTRLWWVPQPGRRAQQWLWLLLLACLLSPLLRPELRRDSAAWAGQLVGQHMAAHWPAGTLVALNTAGAPAYHAPDLRFIDMLGLNDRHIARRVMTTLDQPMQRLPGHMKGDGAYVLSREPDVIMLGWAEGQVAEQSQFLGDKELALSSEFHRCYRLAQVQLSYDADYAHLGKRPLAPMPMTYYERVCPKRQQGAVTPMMPIKPS